VHHVVAPDPAPKKPKFIKSSFTKYIYHIEGTLAKLVGIINGERDPEAQSSALLEARKLIVPRRG
jgi:hypothetical protein